MHPAPSMRGPQPSWAILTAAQQQQQQHYSPEPYDNRQAEQYDDGQEQWGAAPPSQPHVSYAHPSQQSQRKRILGEGKEKEKEPLFLPGSQLSQLPPAAEAAIIESGLGIESMTAEEFEAMLEGDAEEVEFGTAPQRAPQERDEGDAGGGQEDWQMEEDVDEIDYRYGQRQEDSFELVDDVEMEPTQNDGGTKVFRPLFED
ncbi:hypothetical protein ONZ51_g2969 [Trametes cubensis]|uniref:Uncharacterized protein n=1 Tax=Trametes cubensis TaxID=1111947 RepID=A0AAD7TZP3_9APHY|nr:hypothetical protein ONZ51_g2969 [Trametes cubensis]